MQQTTRRRKHCPLPTCTRSKLPESGGQEVKTLKSTGFQGKRGRKWMWRGGKRRTAVQFCSALFRVSFCGSSEEARTNSCYKGGSVKWMLRFTGAEGRGTDCGKQKSGPLRFEVFSLVCFASPTAASSGATCPRIDP